MLKTFKVDNKITVFVHRRNIPSKSGYTWFDLGKSVYSKDVSVNDRIPLMLKYMVELQWDGEGVAPIRKVVDSAICIGDFIAGWEQAEVEFNNNVTI